MEKYGHQDVLIVSSEPITLATDKVCATSLNQAMSAGNTAEVEVHMRCECCGLVEECTPAYVSHIRDVHCGKWVCGLCAEAVKDELVKEDSMGKLHEGIEDALNAHMSMCMQFNRTEKKVNPVADIAAAMRRLLRRSVDGSSGAHHSAPSSPRGGGAITRANSCLSNFSRARGFEAPM